MQFLLIALLLAEAFAGYCDNTCGPECVQQSCVSKNLGRRAANSTSYHRDAHTSETLRNRMARGRLRAPLVDYTQDCQNGNPDHGKYIWDTAGGVVLGVTCYGGLNVNTEVSGLTPSSLSSMFPGTFGGPDTIGLRYAINGNSATEQGCTCEAWGVNEGTPPATLTDNANCASQGGGHDTASGTFNMVIESFLANDEQAVSTVIINDEGVDKWRVTHDYRTNPTIAGLIDVLVTVENMRGSPTPTLYRRAMDWDIDPTPYDEKVTLNPGAAVPANKIYRLYDNGFSAVEDPLGICSFTGDLAGCGILKPGDPQVIDCGPYDHGALFDINLGTIPGGESQTFLTHYGVFQDQATALAGLGSAGIGTYSLAKSSVDSLVDGSPNTFIFGMTTSCAATIVTVSATACGLSDGAIISAASGGTLPYSFSWTGPDGYTGSTAAITGLAAGVYTLTLTDGSDCHHVTIATVSEGSLLVSGVVGPMSINVTATGGTPPYVSYDWTGPNGFISSTEDLSGLAAGLYQVLVTDSATCRAFGSFTVGALPPSSGGSEPLPICDFSPSVPRSVEEPWCHYKNWLATGGYSCTGCEIILIKEWKYCIQVNYTADSTLRYGARWTYINPLNQTTPLGSALFTVSPALHGCVDACNTPTLRCSVPTVP